jgi:hypothetical protein
VKGWECRGKWWVRVSAVMMFCIHSPQVFEVGTRAWLWTWVLTSGSSVERVVLVESTNEAVSSECVYRGASRGRLEIESCDVAEMCTVCSGTCDGGGVLYVQRGGTCLRATELPLSPMKHGPTK